jgi:hypothetical protein
VTKDELLARTREERTVLDELVAHLDADDLATPGVIDGQSVKDLLAHISAWERRICDAIDTWRRGETPAWPEPGATMADVDRLNARDFAAARGRPLADVLGESLASYGRLLRTVEAVDEVVLARVDGLPWSPWPLTTLVRANADEHYREHIDQIDVWVQGQRA